MDAYGDFRAAVRREMERRGVGVKAVAARTHYNHAFLSRVLSGRQRPSAKLAQELDRYLGAGGAVVALYEGRMPGAGSPDGGLAPLPGIHSVDEAQLAPTIRRLSRRLITLDNELHGLPIAESATRAFKAARRRLKGGIGSAYERDVQAAAAELAEIAGWACFNEGYTDASGLFSREALGLARESGDRGIELLTLQNLAMLAGWTDQPHEELTIAQTVIADRALHPRVEAMFRAREGQGLGRTGDHTRSARAFARARSLLQEAAPSDGPEWAWWVSPAEIDRQEGRVRSTTGRWNDAIPVLRRATNGSPESPAVGYRQAAAVWLLDSLLSVQAWRDAQETAEALVLAVRETSSRATLGNLRRVLSRDTSAAPADLRDSLDGVRAALAQDPFRL
ncbi:helix-turn-helix domain-containing protein [Streptomyces sp. enrichment culture]|uniref:helix-turn-helix domain-containing protein n=1 Tax=Streptomyces sp. enrichment culture TaxID=1795815 RepID=UPI003F54314A